MWILYLTLFIISAVGMTQFFRLAAEKTTDPGALTALLQLMAGVCSLIFLPFFEFTFLADPRTYLLLGIACIFYAVSDRMNTVVRSGIEASTYTILKRISTVFMIVAGILFFKEPFLWNKILGAILVIFSNIFVFYQKGRQKFNRYVALGILANFIAAIALFLDVNISQQFNLAIYSTIVVWLPALMIICMERISPSRIKREFTKNNKKFLILTSVCWGISTAMQLLAYKFGEITTVAPLASLTVVGNVIVGYIFLNERDHLWRKIVAAILILISVILING